MSAGSPAWRGLFEAWGIVASAGPRLVAECHEFSTLQVGKQVGKGSGPRSCNVRPVQPTHVCPQLPAQEREDCQAGLPGRRQDKQADGRHAHRLTAPPLLHFPCRVAELAAAAPELEAQRALRKFRKKLESVHSELADYRALIEEFRWGAGGGPDSGTSAAASGGR